MITTLEGLSSEELRFLFKKLRGLTGIRRLIRGESVDLLEDLFRRVSVNSGRSLRESLEATDRNIITSENVLETAPHHDGGDVDIYFFKFDQPLDGDDVERECEKRNGILIGPRSLAAVNEEDAIFADTHPNATCWKGPDGKWYFLVFDRKDGVRRVLAVPGPGHPVWRKEPLWIGYSQRTDITPSDIEPASEDPYDGR